MKSLDYIINKYKLDCSGKMPVEIPETTRNDLGDIFRELGFKTGAEIGVESGVFSEVLFKKNPDLELYGIDPWIPYEGNTWRPEKFKKDHEKAIKRLKPYNSILIKKPSIDAVKDFDDDSLDFVYIDANHSFQHAVNDICEWTRKVRIGGIVSGHDYIKIIHKIRKGGKRKPLDFGVIQAVHGYTSSNSIRPFFVLGRRFKDKTRDKIRSWFFIKE